MQRQKKKQKLWQGKPTLKGMFNLYFFLTQDHSHLYPNKQAEIAAQLENVINGTTVPNGSQMAGVANLQPIKEKLSEKPAK